MLESKEIAGKLSRVSGEDFFKILSSHGCLEASAVCMHIALFAVEDRDTMVTIFCGGTVEVDVPQRYVTSDTFCRDLAEDEGLVCQDNASDQYPEDYLLSTLHIRSCVAIPLNDGAGNLCGSFALLAQKPFSSIATAQKLLRSYASRVAIEALRKQTEAELRHNLWFTQTALDAIPTPIFFKDIEGTFTNWNRAFANFSGLAEQSARYSTDFDGPLSIHAEEDRQLLSDGGTLVVETIMTRADGKQRNVLFHKAGLTSSKGKSLSGLVGTMIDVTDLRTAEEKANYLTHYDGLTGLPNQVMFQDLLNTEIANARRHYERLAVFAIDIDHFKKINNVFGHQQGDELLKDVAQLIRQSIRQEDTVARLGGDSFTALLRNIRYEENAAIIANKIHKSLAQPVLVDNQEVFINVSIGIALYPLDGEDVQSLIKNSDIALHRAKDNGRNTHLFFAPKMNSLAAEQMKLQNSLRRALERNEFFLHYQPQYNAKTAQMTGAEALLRWQHPQLGVIYPNQFIPLAEHLGLIVPIGEWVLRTACRDAHLWNRPGQKPFRVAVNLSPRQFLQLDLYEKIRQIIDETQICPSWLGLEITESAIMQEIDYAVRILDDLKKLGVHLSIDDFGTGYSSLNHLKRFPVDLLKIDRTFITDIPRQNDDVAIVSAVISMAHKLKLKVLAEGVETLEQKDFLHSIRCDEYQGFLFSHPIAAQSLLKQQPLSVELDHRITPARESSLRDEAGSPAIRGYVKFPSHKQ